MLGRALYYVIRMGWVRIAQRPNLKFSLLILGLNTLLNYYAITCFFEKKLLWDITLLAILIIKV